MKKNIKGITLVSLVITIIVMLILAGVSISMATGNNGVLSRGQQGAKKTKLSGIEEDIGLAIGSLTTDYNADWTLESSIEALKSDYYTVENINAGAATNEEISPTSNFIKNHHGMNFYLDKCKILVGTSVKNAAQTITVKGAAGADSLSKMAGCTSAQRGFTSTKSNKTNCGYQLSAMYISNGDTDGAVGADLFVALYYIKNSVPVLVDVGLVESTGADFANGNFSEAAAVPANFNGVYTTAKDAAAVYAKGTKVPGITWLRNSECPNT